MWAKQIPKGKKDRGDFKVSADEMRNDCVEGVMVVACPKVKREVYVGSRFLK
jgi:hypothetical protein